MKICNVTLCILKSLDTTLPTLPIHTLELTLACTDLDYPSLTSLLSLLDACSPTLTTLKLLVKLM